MARILMFHMNNLGNNQFVNPWSEEEIRILKEHYPFDTKENIQNLLKKRTWKSIIQKANTIGLKRKIRVKLLLDFKFTEETSYILGIYLGDASITKYGIFLYVKDEDFADAFFQSLSFIGLRPRKKKYEELYAVYAYSIKFIQWLEQQDIKTIRDVLNNNKEFAINFIRGLYDSEGGYYPEQGNLMIISNINFELVSFIKELIMRHLKIESKLFIKTKRENSFSKSPIYTLFIFKKSEIEKFLKIVDSNIYRKSYKHFIQFNSKKCIRCGIIFIPKSRKQLYCDKCRIIVSKEKQRLYKRISYQKRHGLVEKHGGTMFKRLSLYRQQTSYSLWQ
jgi:ribosomal protein S27AE